MGVLAGGRHPHSPGPVEVHVGQLVTRRRTVSQIPWQTLQDISEQHNDEPDPLHGVHREAQTVPQHDVVGGTDGALSDVLRHEEEVVPVPPGHRVVQHTPRRRVVQLLPQSGQKGSE